MSATTAASLAAEWEMVVGLEVHVQLKTRTKAFCSCSAEYGAPPNVNTCPVCLALPGALPALNERAVELATRAALALNCTVHPVSVFARKNYFYPDLPKGYQISQFDRPLATAGHVEIGALRDGSSTRIGVTRVHMEEDAGKSVHDRYPGVTAIDLNRAGVPLIEIVSEPDMRSAEEAGAYLRVLKQILEYLDVSDVSMEEGSLRVDANVSARRRGETKLGTKTEVKNMNSFSGVERALEMEFVRQVGVLAAGGRVQQQTMLWDGNAGAVRPSRTKEGSHDYRYFPEPDLPPLVLATEWIDRVKHDLPELPAERRTRFATDYALGAYDVDLLTGSPRLADYYEEVARAHGDPKVAANWVMGEVLAQLKASGGGIDTFRVRPQDLAGLLNLLRDGIVSHTAAKQVFAGMLATGDPPAQIAERDGLIKVDDDAQLAAWLDEVVAEMPTEAERFRAGERKLQGVLIGAVMKKSKGRADPRKLNQLLSSRLGT
ncbi:MAG: Asp-tRNA(Asn)/Glu-tRNA(Gln) amidotransferase subunit GatB [Gemmatimonadaceae bacterium]|nr:Asp-tRNA(Asn)/Glu-tRNA(Gln) amidotransferase subunit GatB [Gemmatimonadaceae bacterium]NUO94879.1 Asp-tRNA(Asn)/Glu-tRNA(Gln) amidotransferase subunit GatB [Gemmatimonadaceae bacterium]NUP56961.1 Asp-tRNA(Asn)/Glu-tRNA(Gln) amidotransferase subunit GatB [Gemmatimonadaceae bacterium]NUP71166.1 Asp-tRNA(Asn)/Glu-tRNA(Gln) amidotransferase subunit GatB [Gemmatimonadaceae bacterium]NUR35076.1 Asp-tRNA(Asn)/Glu-tRNA(Gln) amidotransferase subunit GatB [Gemmatimonadaceae bacterium]